MLGEICAEIKNYFTYEHDKHIGDWTISDGTFSPTLDFPTKYFRVIGSRNNDGVHEITNQGSGLTDESFHGAVWIMSPPKDFLDLVAEITEWQEKNGTATSNNMSLFRAKVTEVIHIARVQETRLQVVLQFLLGNLNMQTD